jgi:hypothetical protein
MWLQKYNLILRYRKEANAAGQILGMVDLFRKFLPYYEEQSWNDFTNNVLLTGNVSYHLFPKELVCKAYRAWKPFIKHSISTRNDFWEVIIQGKTVLQKIKSIREKGKACHNISRLSTEMEYVDSQEIRYVIVGKLKFNNSQRLRFAKADQCWLVNWITTRYGNLFSILKYQRYIHGEVALNVISPADNTQKATLKVETKNIK